MPESVKISELPPLSSVQPNDIVPVVDEFFTQTSRATASQIAAIGGGPPGANTVSEASLQDGAVTAAKCKFTGPDKLFSRIATGPGSGVEIDCTPYARGLLAAQSGIQAREYLDALQTTDNPTFTGQVKLANGSVNVPSLVGIRDLGTGMFFPTSGSIAFASGGVETWRLMSDGTLQTNVFMPDPLDGTPNPTPILRPSYGSRAWANFNGQSLAGTSLQVGPNASLVAQRYNLPGWGSGGPASIWDTEATRNKMLEIEAARGIQLEFPTTPQFNDAYGRGTFPAYNRGTETRANYTSPGDDRHWYWDGSAWVQTPTNVTGKWWIGTIRLVTPSSQSAIRDARNIASVRRNNAAGNYTVFFGQSMPDTNYCIIGTCSNNPIGGAPGVVIPTTYGTDSCTLLCRQTTDNAAYDPTFVNVAIYR